MITFNPTELTALEKRLQQVAEKVGKKALRSAARKAMNEVRKEARDNAPQDSGLLDHNFGLLTRIKGADVVAKVGIRGGARENETTPYYWRFVEFGTQKSAARPFLRPALENNSQHVFDTLAAELKKALDA